MTDYSRTYHHSLSCSITAWAENRRFKYAEIDRISYSIMREAAPVRTIASPPFKRKIAIAGCLVFKEFYHPEPIHTFDIELTALNEYAKKAIMHIKGLEIWTEEGPWSPSNMYETDIQYCFLAKRIMPWEWVDRFQGEDRRLLGQGQPPEELEDR